MQEAVCSTVSPRISLHAPSPMQEDVPMLQRTRRASVCNKSGERSLQNEKIIHKLIAYHGTPLLPLQRPSCYTLKGGADRPGGMHLEVRPPGLVLLSIPSWRWWTSEGEEGRTDLHGCTICLPPAPK